jgi:vacuolar-type H+-ATPase subunit I/STV1
MLFQINNSFIHLKDAIIKEEFDNLDEYNQAFKSDIIANKKLIIAKKKKTKASSSKEKNYLQENANHNLIYDSNEFKLNNPQEQIDKKKKTFYELNSNLHKNKSTLNSLCNTKEHSSRLINSLSTTQKILMIASFIASELDPSKDCLYLRGIKKTIINKRKVI